MELPHSLDNHIPSSLSLNWKNKVNLIISNTTTVYITKTIWYSVGDNQWQALQNLSYIYIFFHASTGEYYFDHVYCILPETRVTSRGYKSNYFISSCSVPVSALRDFTYCSSFNYEASAFVPKFVFHCFLTSYCKLSGLRQHTFIASQFPWVRGLHPHLAGSSAQGLKAAMSLWFSFFLSEAQGPLSRSFR